MAELNFEIQGSHGDITVTAFEKAVATAVLLLREFDAAVSGIQKESLSWYVDRLNSNGNLNIRFRSRVKVIRGIKEAQDVSGRVLSSLLSGLDDLENKCSIPQYLSEYGMQTAARLTSLIGKNGTTGFQFAYENRSVAVTSRTSENIGKLLLTKRTAIGSVEGKLETINLHGTPRVQIYHAITKRAVTCRFDPALFMPQIKEFLGKRVIAFGTLEKNINGDTLRVRLDRLELPEAVYARATKRYQSEFGLPDFANTSSTAEYIKRARSARSL